MAISVPLYRKRKRKQKQKQKRVQDADGGLHTDVSALPPEQQSDRWLELMQTRVSVCFSAFASTLKTYDVTQICLRASELTPRTLKPWEQLRCLRLVIPGDDLGWLADNLHALLPYTTRWEEQMIEVGARVASVHTWVDPRPLQVG